MIRYRVNAYAHNLEPDANGGLVRYRDAERLQMENERLRKVLTRYCPHPSWTTLDELRRIKQCDECGHVDSGLDAGVTIPTVSRRDAEGTYRNQRSTDQEPRLARPAKGVRAKNSDHRAENLPVAEPCTCLIPDVSKNPRPDDPFSNICAKCLNIRPPPTEILSDG